MRWIKKLVEEIEENKHISLFLGSIVLCIIIYCSSISGNSISFNSIWPSIIYHFSVFAGLGFVLSMLVSQKEKGIKEVLIVIGISLIIAILDEAHQMFTPLRTPDIKDILTDMGGVIFSIILHSGIKRIKV